MHWRSSQQLPGMQRLPQQMSAGLSAQASPMVGQASLTQRPLSAWPATVLQMRWR
jgi:hypothetical protein